MDTDVEVIKPIDGFLKHPAFSGFECTLKIPTGIIAAEKNNHWIKLMLDYYNDKQFVNSDGTFELVSNVIFMSELTKKNYKIEFNDVCYFYTCRSIPIWILCFTHFLVYLFICY